MAFFAVHYYTLVPSTLLTKRINKVASSGCLTGAALPRANVTTRGSVAAVFIGKMTVWSLPEDLAWRNREFAQIRPTLLTLFMMFGALILMRGMAHILASLQSVQ
jgi:hypothetical protein